MPPCWYMHDHYGWMRILWRMCDLFPFACFSSTIPTSTRHHFSRSPAQGVDVTARIPQLMALLPRYHLQVEAPGQLQQQYKAQRGLMRGSEVVALFMERG